MKTGILSLFMAVTLLTVSSNVMAAPTGTPAAMPGGCGELAGSDIDSDGYCSPDPSGLEDCAPADPNVHPNATEIVNDGIDNDCDGQVDEYVRGFEEKFGCQVSDANCLRVLHEEIDRCEDAGASQCLVNKTQGIFVTLRGYYFVDRDCDGYREIIDQNGYDKLVKEIRASQRNPSWLPQKNGRCDNDMRSHCDKPNRKGGGSGKPAGPSTKDKEQDKKLVDHDTKLAEHDKTLGDLSDVTKESFEKITKIGKKIEEEAAIREQEDKILSGRINGLQDGVAEALENSQTAQTSAERAITMAGDALSTGVSFSLQVGFAAVVQNPINLPGGSVARGSFAPTITIGVDIGAELDAVLLLVDANLLLPFDTGPSGDLESGIGGQGGASCLARVSGDHFVGGGAGVIYREAGGDILATNGASRGGYLEGTYRLASSRGNLRGDFEAGATLIYEEIGTQSDKFEGSGSGLAAMFFLRGGFGIGPKGRPSA